MKRPCVVLADRHVILLEGLRRLLDPEFEVVAAVENGHSVLASAGEFQPDVIVLELSLPLLSGLDAVRQLRRIVPRVKVIFLSGEHDPIAIDQAFRAGASAYVLKECTAAELAAAMRRALTGRRDEKWLIRKGTVQRYVEQTSGKKETSIELTARQREVLQLVAEGHSLKEIASVLGISVKTAQFHKYRLMDRLKVHTTAELIQYAIRRRIVLA